MADPEAHQRWQPTMTRGAFRFNNNHYPIQDYYLRVITRDSQGRVTNRTIGTVFKNHVDAYAGTCKMGS